MYGCIKSMTGYGRASKDFETMNITVEIRSVNHRFADISVKTPKLCGFLELPIKTRAAGEILRGKTDIYISCESLGSGSGEISANERVLEQYMRVFADLQQRFNIPGQLEISDIIRLPDVIRAQKSNADEQEFINNVLEVFETALKEFIAMRTVEGRKLAKDIHAQLDEISGLTDIIERRAPVVIEEYREKLFCRMSKILDGIEPDNQKIFTEAAFFADRAAIDEEIVRIRSHVAQIREILNEPKDAAGKKLDFLTQELNREANTIGSKANDCEIAKCVIRLKSEIEKIREQVQNIE